MHYCLALFTKDLPTKPDIDNLMKKYNSEDVYSDDEKEIDYPQFTWDWYQIGGRYSGQIKLRVDKEDEKYRWKYIARDKRNGRLFWSYLLSKMQEFSKESFLYHEEDYFASMGYRDGFLYVDGAKISDITNIDEIGCFTFMNADGEAYSREWWNGNGFVENSDFEEKFKSEIKKCSDMFLTIIDYHD